jgi:hypothetical protein
MTQFWKRPKFWVNTILIAWVAYIIYANFQLAPVPIHLVPHFVQLQLRISGIIIGSAIGGAALTLALQFLWRKRSSKNASQSAAAAASSSSTVA